MDKPTERFVKSGIIKPEDADEAERLASHGLHVFFDSPFVRGRIRGYMEDERAYAGDVIKARIPDGALGKILHPRRGEPEQAGSIAVGRIMELVSKDRRHAEPRCVVDDLELLDEMYVVGRLAARSGHVRVKGSGRKGAYLSMKSSSPIHRQGRKTYDERDGRDMLRVEYRLLGGDHILGMFYAWEDVRPELPPLLVYVSRAQLFEVRDGGHGRK